MEESAIGEASPELGRTLVDSELLPDSEQISDGGISSGRNGDDSPTDRQNDEDITGLNYTSLDLAQPMPTVVARNARFSYGRHKVLHNLNMTVRFGTIYGLLGPSGCGKTTLLNLILGRHSAKHGFLRVFGHKPGGLLSPCPGSDVGYMPQSIALYPELTISQTLFFHSQLHGMSFKKFFERKKWLLQFLDLPRTRRLVSNLSGGQQRRVSLAVALLHSPRLLLLDEPTVGVDPLLRKRIWNHLVDLKKMGVTILITTHYIQEAIKADCVGMMRSGKLLVEENPHVLLETTGQESLEDLFLKLCEGYGDEETNNLPKSPKSSANPDAHTPLLNGDGKPSSVFSNYGVDMPDSERKIVDPSAPPVSAIRNADVDVGGDEDMVAPTAPPVSASRPDDSDSDVPSFHSSRMSSPVPFSLPKSNEYPNVTKWKHVESEYEKGTFHVEGIKLHYYSRNKILWLLFNLLYIPIILGLRKILQLMRNPRMFIFALILPTITIFLVCITIGGDPFDINLGVVNHDLGIGDLKLSTGIIEQIKTDHSQSINFKHYESTQDALGATRKNSVWGYVYFPPEFTFYMYLRSQPEYFSNKTVIERSMFHTRLDQSNQQVSLMIEMKLNEGFTHYIDRKFNTTMEGAMSLDLAVYGDNDAKYITFIAPGMIVQTLYGFSQALTAVSSVRERIDGTLERAFAAGTRPLIIIMGFKICFTIVSFMQMVPVFLVAFVGFALPLKGSVFAMLLVCFMLVQVAMSAGLLVASISPSEFSATNTSFGLYMPVMLMSGIIWPQQALPKYIKWLPFGLPLLWAADAMRSICIRGWGFAGKNVWPSLLISLGWEIGFIFGATMLLKFHRGK